MSAPPLLQVRDLRVEYPIHGGLLGPAKRLVAVETVSFSLTSGRTLGIVGESGCGKSTLGRALLGFAKPTSGQVLFEGKDISSLSERAFRPLRSAIQIVMQNPLASLNPRMTVGDLVAEPLEAFAPELDRDGRLAKAGEMLAAVGLGAECLSRYPHEFSGGQCQRINIARAMISRPKLLVCDEAVSALDVSVKAQIVNLLRQLQKETGVAMVFISHDLAIVRQMADDLLVMYLGRTMEAGSAAELFVKPAHPYTQALIAAVPEPFGGEDSLAIVLNEELPDPLDPPSGCVFRTRCPAARPNCITLRPALAPFAEGHAVACHYAGVDLAALVSPAQGRPKG
jgi:oligopeptide transport system ATP-binding protein